jgi:hypothetical protein
LCRRHTVSFFRSSFWFCHRLIFSVTAVSSSHSSRPIPLCRSLSPSAAERAWCASVPLPAGSLFFLYLERDAAEGLRFLSAPPACNQGLRFLWFLTAGQGLVSHLIFCQGVIFLSLLGLGTVVSMLGWIPVPVPFMLFGFRCQPRSVLPWLGLGVPAL